MKFKYEQLVRLKGAPYMGRVAGFCHFTRPYNSEYSNNTSVREGVIVNLTDGFYDPSKKMFVSMVIVDEDALENW